MFCNWLVACRIWSKQPITASQLNLSFLRDYFCTKSSSSSWLRDSSCQAWRRRKVHRSSSSSSSRCTIDNVRVYIWLIFRGFKSEAVMDIITTSEIYHSYNPTNNSRFTYSIRCCPGSEGENVCRAVVFVQKCIWWKKGSSLLLTREIS